MCNSHADCGCGRSKVDRELEEYERSQNPHPIVACELGKLDDYAAGDHYALGRSCGVEISTDDDPQMLRAQRRTLGGPYDSTPLYDALTSGKTPTKKSAKIERSIRMKKDPAWKARFVANVTAFANSRKIDEQDKVVCRQLAVDVASYAPSYKAADAIFARRLFAMIDDAIERGPEPLERAKAEIASYEVGLAEADL